MYFVTFSIYKNLIWKKYPNYVVEMAAGIQVGSTIIIGLYCH